MNFAKPVRIVATGEDFQGLVLRGITGIEWVGGTVTGTGGRSYGISIAQSRNVRIENVVVSGAHRGIVVDRSASIVLIGNRLTRLISDGIDIALSHGVRANGTAAITSRPRRPNTTRAASCYATATIPIASRPGRDPPRRRHPILRSSTTKPMVTCRACVWGTMCATAWTMAGSTASSSGATASASPCRTACHRQRTGGIGDRQ